MKIFLQILTILLLLPIAIVMVALICISLIGGYITGVLALAWPLVLIVIGGVIGYKIFKKFID